MDVGQHRYLDNQGDYLGDVWVTRQGDVQGGPAHGCQFSSAVSFMVGRSPRGGERRG